MPTNNDNPVMGLLRDTARKCVECESIYSDAFTECCPNCSCMLSEDPNIDITLEQAQAMIDLAIQYHQIKIYNLTSTRDLLTSEEASLDEQ